MKKLTTEQTECIAIVETSLMRLDNLSKRVHNANMLILEKELFFLHQGLKGALLLQLRAFRDDSLTDPEPLFPTGFFPYGKKT